MPYQPPLYTAGQVIDVRYDTKIGDIKVCMPDRNYIEAVYRKVEPDCWMLTTISEAKGGEYYIPQDQLFKNQSDHKAEVYKLPHIQMMLNLGYRFVKNMPVKVPGDSSTETYCSDILIRALSQLSEVDEVVTMEAYNPDGMVYTSDRPYIGIWIKYKNVIHADNQYGMPNYTSVYKAP